MNDLRKLRRMVLEEAIRASAEYAAKETVRADLQKLLQDRVASGAINDEAGLASFWKTLDMAATALKMVPLDALRRGKAG